MKRKKKSKDWKDILIISITIIIAAVLIYFLKSPITGLVVVEQFLDSNNISYIYDESLINISDGEIRLIPLISTYNWTEENVTKIYVNSAIYNDNNKTAKIIALDGSKLDVNKNKIFNVIFNSELNNNDIISLYLLKSDANDIYLCNTNESCESPGYGLVDYDGNESWYNITISNLNNSVNGFNIDPIKVEFDYIEAMHIDIIEYSEENISWENASLETEDINFDKMIDFILFNKEDSGNVSYEYSVDSGEEWNEVNDSLLNIYNEKVKFKINLFDNDSVVYGFNLNYSINISTNYEINNSGYIDIVANEDIVISSRDFILNLKVNKTIFNTLVEIGNSNLIDNLNKSIDIKVDDEVNNNLVDAVIKIYYTDEDVSNFNLDENSLKIGYYNGSEWVMLNSTVNIEENYVTANVDHFSIYGLFGENVASESSPASGGTSGGGRHHEFEEEKPEEEVKEETEEEKIVTENKQQEVITGEMGKGLLSGRAIFSKDNIIKYTRENLIFIIIVGLIILFYLGYRLTHHKIRERL